jgi:hypothetical protein
LLSIVIDVDIRHDSVQFSKNIRFLSPKRQDLIYHVSLLVAIHIFFQFEKEKIKTPFIGVLITWQRPTLPGHSPKYHWR